LLYSPVYSNSIDLRSAAGALILTVYGEEAGTHARSAVGMASLPFNIPVEVEAEVEING